MVSHASHNGECCSPVACEVPASVSADTDLCEDNSLAVSADDANPHLKAGLVGQLIYKACYTVSFGVCFPVCVAYHYLPKKNHFFTGLQHGHASAHQSVDEMLERARANRLAQDEFAEQRQEMAEIIECGAGALEPI